MAAMHTKKIFAGVAMLLLGAAMAQAQASKQLLDQLDAASKRFQNVQAEVQFDQYTSIVKEHDISTGTMFVEKTGSGDNMAASVKDAGAPSSAKVVVYSGGVLQIYSLAAKQVDIFKAGANQGKYESFLTLGF